MKRVYKYGTGEEIPDGAIYLTTIVEMKEIIGSVHRLVWHYFLVDVVEG
jgi:hypothetical protein